MGTLLRYLMAYGVQLAWQRSGKTGATPPMRMPFGKNKGKAMPMIGPWQMMILMWIARQIWAIYGNQVKAKLSSTNHPVASHIGNILPPAGSTPSAATTAPNVAQTPPPAAAPPAAASRPVPQYGTQVLSDSDSDPANLPPGSVLSGLRGQNP